MTSARPVVCCRCGCLKKISNGIVAGLEILFYKLGGLVGRNPWKTIGLCVLVCGLMGVGLINHNEERRYMKNYVPRGSRILAEHEWITANFPGVRVESLIIEDENILTAESINAIFDVYEAARQITTVDGENMTDFCFSFMQIKCDVESSLRSFLKGAFCIAFDLHQRDSTVVDKNSYINGPTCQVSSVLELWLYNRSLIRNLTDDDVYATVNQEKITNPYYQAEIHPQRFLGRISRDDNGKIIGASATVMVYLLEGNKSSEQAAMDWEMQLIHLVNEVGHPHLQKIYIYSTRSYDDEAMGTMYNDLKLLFIGFSLVFLYLTLSISQLSLVHHKVLLASAGLLSIGLSICFTYGFACITGIMFGQIHQILPFMLLGIGVDDVFVIMESLNNLTPKERMLPVDIRIAHTLKNAGVSITVTSVTDMAAFAIGSTTVIPALSTFCIYTAIGVFALYVLQATFFVACLALDEKRKDSRRDACILCYKHEATYKPNQFYTFSVQHHFMKKIWGPGLTKLPIKVLVLLLYLGLTGLNVWSCMQIKFDYDPNKYLPEASYATEYVAADRKYFPESGPYTEVFCGEADYARNVDALLQLYDEIRNKPTVQPNTVDFWLGSFQQSLYSPTFSSLQAPYVYDGTVDQSRYQKTHPIEPNDSFTKSPQHVINSSTVSPRSSLNPLLTSRNSKELTLQLNNSQPLTNIPGILSSGTSNDSNRTLTQANSWNTSVDVSNISTKLSKSQTSPQFKPKGIFLSSSNVSDIRPQPDSFVNSVCHFLQTPQGQVYSRFVKIDCLASPATIEGSVLAFRQIRCNTSKCDIDAMDDMRALVDSLTLDGGGRCFVYSDPQYMYNESNQVLKVGLYRNLALAAVSVFVVTLILITNMWTSTLVFMCVVCTMIDVAGTMVFWDIYLDIASGVILILCFGLAVEFSAHVGHSFMTKTGTGNERLQQTLVSIGPAVFSGGFSTFLAFSILYFTTSYAFVLFCRLFTLVVVYGLFHGLTVLPVILSVVGPPPYEKQVFSDTADISKQHVNVTETMLPNGNCDRVGLKDVSVRTNNGSVKQNGFIPHKPSEESLEDSSLSETSSKYSGSYYATRSDGSWEEINCHKPH